MDKLKADEVAAAEAAAIRNNNNNNPYYADGGNVGEGVGGYGTGYGTAADRFGDMMAALGYGDMSEAGKADAEATAAETAGDPMGGTWG